MQPVFKIIKSKEDIKIISETAHEIWREYFPKIIGEDQTEYMLRKYLTPSAITENISRSMIYYAVVTDKDTLPAGFFAFSADDSGLYLSKLYVKRKYRGYGFSSKIIAFLKKYCIEKSYKRIYLSCNKYNSKSIDIYQHLGFVNIDSTCESIGDIFFCDDYTFELKISV